MDGRGRLAQPVTPRKTGERTGVSTASATSRRRLRRAEPRAVRPSRYERWIERRSVLLRKFWLTRGGGFAFSLLIILASIGYGVIKGGHLDPLVASYKNARDFAGNLVGFRIKGIAFSGQKNINREEILARAGISGTSSLLFLDVADARNRLMSDPRIADATIQKLYPDRLQITIVERSAFALWQKNGRISVIAHDGSVLEPYVSRPFVDLPLLVGTGAEKRGREFLQLLDRYPEVRANVRASILIAERRWNLRLKNGLDVKLPETGVDRALERLVALDRDLKLTSRDITVLDLRQSDRVTVRLSEAAAQARDAAIKEKAKQKKGGNA